MDVALQTDLQLAVIRMGADPKPNNFVFLLDTYGAIIDINSDRIDRLSRMNTFKTKAGIKWVYFELFIGLFGLLLDLLR